MMKTPYEVLGVSENASDEEIKRTYWELVRKYHPDTNVNNPLADLAAEKFKEVQEAYEAIMKERAGGYGGGRFSGSAWQGGSREDVRMQQVADLINRGQCREALQLLDRMSERTAMWYYASGCANAGVGNLIVAREHAAMAVNMEPSNIQYRQLLDRIESVGRQYQSYPFGRTPGRGSSCGTGNLCCDLWLADTLCECMGGDLCSCM